MRHLMRVIIVTCTVAFAGCGNAVSDSAAVSTDSPRLAIEFAASRLDGSSLVLSEQLAQNPVALWFGAPG